MDKDYYKQGSWNSVCAVCGFKKKSDELKKRWDGVYVCEQDWEPRNILDFFKVRPDHQAVPWTQHDTTVVNTEFTWVDGSNSFDWQGGPISTSLYYWENI